MPCAQCAIITFSTKGKIFRVCAMILVYVKRGKVLSLSFEKNVSSFSWSQYSGWFNTLQD